MARYNLDEILDCLTDYKSQGITEVEIDILEPDEDCGYTLTIFGVGEDGMIEEYIDQSR